MIFKTRWLCAALIPVATMSWAQTAQPEAATVNPQVVAKLVQMGEYLRSLRSFSVTSDITRDVVLESGQKIQALGTNELAVNGKTRLYAKIDTDRIKREYFYNGKELTQYAAVPKYFTTVPVADNVYDMLHQVESHYGLELPMEDMFNFGSSQEQVDGLKSAIYVGPSMVGGKQCDHLAFRQAGSDWQLWVTRSKTSPLPCKLVITSTDDASHPEYSEVYRWNLKPALADSRFTFKPGKGDVAIPMNKLAK